MDEERTSTDLDELIELLRIVLALDDDFDIVAISQQANYFNFNSLNLMAFPKGSAETKGI